jgi:hypothetical protein
LFSIWESSLFLFLLVTIIGVGERHLCCVCVWALLLLLLWKCMDSLCCLRFAVAAPVSVIVIIVVDVHATTTTTRSAAPTRAVWRFPYPTHARGRCNGAHGGSAWGCRATAMFIHGKEESCWRGTTKVLEGFMCAMICAILGWKTEGSNGEGAMREEYMQVQIDGTFCLE